MVFVINIQYSFSKLQKHLQIKSWVFRSFEIVFKCLIEKFLSKRKSQRPSIVLYISSLLYLRKRVENKTSHFKEGTLLWGKKVLGILTSIYCCSSFLGKTKLCKKFSTPHNNSLNFYKAKEQVKLLIHRNWNTLKLECYLKHHQHWFFFENKIFCVVVKLAMNK